jgi:hypothetical protein
MEANNFFLPLSALEALKKQGLFEITETGNKKTAKAKQNIVTLAFNAKNPNKLQSLRLRQGEEITFQQQNPLVESVNNSAPSPSVKETKENKETKAK